MPGEPNAVLYSKTKKKKKKRKNKKKKEEVLETVKPDLRVDASSVATYKDSSRKVSIDYSSSSSSFVVAAAVAAADAVIMAASIADAQIALLELFLQQLH